ncbi:recombination regulator RecX [Neisseria perflava]|uniref:recombination regulator RecX n=1 Tax=Neisseria perflava TaxID=33053 RepID=UPI0026469F80|nr:recombination regulator RecX [Neisseria perflava]MCP1660145.1 regulatory protein [Neisseria perflava]MCP1772604.1 regulatory protein [Neisseria perflava]
MVSDDFEDRPSEISDGLNPPKKQSARPEKSLRARAMDILSRQEISRSGLKRKLAPHAESEAELEKVLDEFAERNWQSDERYAEAYIHSKSRQHGTLRLKQALAAQGVDEDLSRRFLPDRDSEQQTAMAVLRKKFKQPAADLKEKQKQVRFLAYRGFGMDTIQTALKHAWDEDEN